MLVKSVKKVFREFTWINMSTFVYIGLIIHMVS